MLGCKGLIVSFLVSGLFPRSYISSDADGDVYFKDKLKYGKSIRRSMGLNEISAR